jgi:hypothetical protein
VTARLLISLDRVFEAFTGARNLSRVPDFCKSDAGFRFGSQGRYTTWRFVPDLTHIEGVDVMVAQTLVSEVGLDMSRWKTEAHFAS